MLMLELLKVIIIGIVQGITEWLPISSTGHMILVEQFVALKVSEEFMSMFNVLIQLGSIMAVVILYFHKLNPFSPQKDSGEKKDTMILWSKVLIASIPAGVIGILFDDKIDAIFHGYLPVSITLIVYGVLFIIIERYNRHRRPRVRSLGQISYQTAFFIGAFQMLALIPGTSRSGATILGAMIIGLSRGIAAEFSFFMAIPAMFGGSFIKLLKFGLHFTAFEATILITGMLVAFIVSIIAIKVLLRYIRNNDFTVFGYYRIILGIILIGYFVLFV